MRLAREAKRSHLFRRLHLQTRYGDRGCAPNSLNAEIFHDIRQDQSSTRESSYTHTLRRQASRRQHSCLGPIRIQQISNGPLYPESTKKMIFLRPKVSIRMFTCSSIGVDPAFFPMGNTSAKFLLEGIPPGQDANILLMGCGDPRYILFTSYIAQDDDSKIDLTCCDLEPAILARNILLLSLIIDDPNCERSLNHWRIFYHLKIDSASLSILHKQARRLFELSETVDSWHGSAYGLILRMVNQDTLCQLRSLWRKYFEGQNSEEYLASLAKFFGDWDTKEIQPNYNAIRSMGPFSSTLDSKSIALQSLQHWRTGVAGGNRFDIETAHNPNPMFIFTSLGHRFTFDPGQNPLLGFHLEVVQPNLLKNSPLCEDFWSKSRAPTQGRGIYDNLVQAAKVQFREWSKAFNAMALKNRIVIRFYVGDCLRFCRALEVCRQKGPDAASFDYTAAQRATPLNLDGGDYKLSSPSPAPMIFDVIETSNLQDFFGLLNILIATIPLLSSNAYSTLYTERLGGDPTPKRLKQILCGDVVTMSLLLGVAPSAYMAGTSSNSSSQERYISAATNARFLSPPGGIGLDIRISWKRTTLGDMEMRKYLGDEIEPKCKFESHELAAILHDIHNKMFCFKGLMMFPPFHRMPYWYTRKTYAELLRLVKNRVDTDWPSCMKSLLERIRGGGWGLNSLIRVLKEATGLHLGIGRAGFLDLLLQMRQSGVYDSEMASLYPLPGIPSVIDVVTVVLKVPRDKMKGIIRQSGDPRLLPVRVSLSGVKFVTSSLQTVYGRLIHSDDGLSATIEEDMNAKDLLVIFDLDTGSLLKTTSITFGLLSPFPGPHRSVHKSTLRNKNDVTILGLPPNISHRRPVLEEPTPITANSISTNSEYNFTVPLVSSNQEGSIEAFSTLLQRLPPGSHTHGGELSARVGQKSPCTAIVDIPGYHPQTLVSPYPLDPSRSKFFMKESGAQKLPQFGVSIPPLRPTSKASSGVSRSPINTKPPVVWAMPRINLDRLPIIDKNQHQKPGWLNYHLFCMYSDREYKTHQEKDSNTELKDSLASIFLNGLDLSHPEKIFKIQWRGKGSILIFVSNILLDLGSRTVVADAWVLPLSNFIESSEKKALQAIYKKGISLLLVSDEEMKRWWEILPSFVERCRSWEHKPSCEYARQGIPLTGDSPLCSCGVGKAPQRVSAIKRWRPFEKYWTRAAIAPLFAFPYTEACVYPFNDELEIGSSTSTNVKRGLSYRPEIPGFVQSLKAKGRVVLFDAKSADGDIKPKLSGKKRDACLKCKQKVGIGAMFVCKGCRVASYCSVKCQNADRKHHNALCKILRS